MVLPGTFRGAAGANRHQETTMNETEMETMLYEMLNDEDAAPEVRRVQTFEEAGVLTYNRGVVVRTDDDSTFQISIVKSR